MATDSATRLRLDHRRLGLRWCRVGPAPGREGLQVAILECGRRFADDEYAERLSQLRRSVWMPKLGMKGILRLTRVPRRDDHVRQRCRRRQPRLRADAVPGVSDNSSRSGATSAATLVTSTSTTRGRADARRRHTSPANAGRSSCCCGWRRISVCRKASSRRASASYFGEPGVTVADPYFGGEGPARSRLHRVRPVPARLPQQRQEHPAEELSLVRRAPRRRDHRRAHGQRDQAARRGRRFDRATRSRSERTGAWMRKDATTLTAGGVVVAAGALGTNLLLAQCKHAGTLPAISDRLGHLVRTNSESLTAVTVPEDRGWSRSVSITGSIFPDADSHSETVTYGTGGNLMGLMFTLLTPDGTRITRPLKLHRADRSPPGAFRPGDQPERLVAAHVAHRRDAVARQLDALRAQTPLLGGRAAADPAGPRASESDVPAAGQRDRPTHGRAHRGDRAELDHRGGAEHAGDRAHPRRRRRRRRPLTAASSTWSTACSVTRTCSSATAPPCPPTPA